MASRVRAISCPVTVHRTFSCPDGLVKHSISPACCEMNCSTGSWVCCGAEAALDFRLLDLFSTAGVLGPSVKVLFLLRRFATADMIAGIDSRGDSQSWPMRHKPNDDFGDAEGQESRVQGRLSQVTYIKLVHRNWLTRITQEAMVDDNHNRFQTPSPTTLICYWQ